ncbi:isopentenyl phosphate kinase [Thermoproteota archaeon]
MQILKLGGSVITHKDKYFAPDYENIKRLAQEIAESKPKSLIIIHGAGSFGHPLAKKYAILEGLKSYDQLIGFSKTHQSMTSLNQIIVDILLEAGISAFSISTSSMLVTKGRRLVDIDLSIIKKCIETGLIPVMYGDAVLDSEQGIAILSGDQLITRLAIELNAEQVIFGSDVDGIFTSNPKLDANAKLIETVSLSNMNADVGDTTFSDVTGGMIGKLSEAEDAVNFGTKVIFLNATVAGRVGRALKGEKVMGTLLTL